MAPFVPRQRKYKVRRRLEGKIRERSGDDSNALEIAPSTTQREEKKKAIKSALRTEQPKMSSKKQKRLDKYIVRIHRVFQGCSSKPARTKK